jgi:hypothetical protein
MHSVLLHSHPFIRMEVVRAVTAFGLRLNNNLVLTRTDNSGDRDKQL